MSVDGSAVSDRARLLAAFDAVWASSGFFTLWQKDEPDAPDALDAWVSARGMTMTGRRLPTIAAGHDVVVDVVGPQRCRITVYVLADSAVRQVA